MRDGSGSQDVSVLLQVQPDTAVTASLSAAETALFAAVGRSVPMQRGDALFQRGDTGQTMYVVQSGRVALDFGDGMQGRELGPGEFFGELGLLIGSHARSATASVVEDGMLHELGVHSLEALLQRDPRLVAQFLHRAIVRIVHNEQSLTRRLRRRNEEIQETLDKLRSTMQELSQTEALTRKDELTGLSNRRGCQEFVERLGRTGTLGGHALLLVDCDDFKVVNDRHGHMAGDRVLQNVANILESVAGSNGCACRLGGDEFALIVRAEDQAELERVASFILGTARTLLEMQSSPPAICTLSLGGTWVDAGTDWHAWYTSADEALYRAKREGGGRVHWHHAAERAA